jgi:hypothetical protein
MARLDGLFQPRRGVWNRVRRRHADEVEAFPERQRVDEFTQLSRRQKSSSA